MVQVKASRLVDLVHGGKPARRAWKSLRKQLNADLERPLHHDERWVAIRGLLNEAVGRETSKEVDAYLRAAAHLLVRLAKDTDRPLARATCQGVAAAIFVQLGDPATARRAVRQSVRTIQQSLTVYRRASRGAQRRTRYYDQLYRQRYLGNEVMALRGFLGEELVVLDSGTSDLRGPKARKATARKPQIRGGRAKVPSWDEILLGVAQAPD